MDRRAVDRWIAEYFRCWKERDADHLVELFTKDAIYRSDPFREPHVGSEEIHRYWSNSTSTQAGFRHWIGVVGVDGDRAWVEWWATWTEGNEPYTLPGCLLLRFSPDGRCSELREYWHVDHTLRDPPPGWLAPDLPQRD